ncbi:MAG: sensor histidine kinase [Spirochaetales bacterium]
MSIILKKLMWTYSLVISGIMIVVVVFVVSVFPRRLRALADSAFSDRANILQDELDGRLSSLFGIVDLVRLDPLIQDVLAASEPSAAELFELQTRLALLNQRLGQGQLVARLVVVTLDGNVLDPLYGNPRYETLLWESHFFSDFRSSREYCALSQPGLFPPGVPDSLSLDRLSLTFGCRLLDGEEYAPFGYLLMVLQYSVLFEGLTTLNHDAFDEVVVVNRDGNVIYSMNNVIDRGTIEPLPSRRLGQTARRVIAAQRYIEYARPVPTSDWTMYGFVSWADFSNEVVVLTVMVVGLAFAMILVSYNVTLPIAKGITRPVVALAKRMEEFDDGELPAPLDYKSDGELQTLLAGYNRMVERISSQVAEIHREQEQKRTAEVDALRFELGYLQAQINPHFIHNSLNALSYLAEKAGNYDILWNVGSLNRLLRAALHDVRDVTPLSEELELLEDFVRIQRMRYGNKFELELVVPDAIADALVPRMILQPIVENAIFHGLSGGDDSGRVTVHGQKDGHLLVLSVSDKSSFVSDAPLAFESAAKQRFSGIGLRNVQQRLQLLFPESGMLRITHREEGGTHVTLTMPLEYADE